MYRPVAGSIYSYNGLSSSGVVFSGSIGRSSGAISVKIKSKMVDMRLEF